LPLEFGRNCVTNPPKRGEHPEKCKRAAVNYLFAINLDGQFAIVSTYEEHFNTELFAQKRRRTGGLNARNSIATSTNNHRHMFVLGCTAVDADIAEGIGWSRFSTA
jgi:hypothetical protein